MKNTKQSCSVSISATPLPADQVTLNFSLESPYNKKMRLLIWYTPFEGFLSDLFIITHSKTGKQLNYQGPMVKRLQPQPEDYLSVSSNEVTSAKVNLSLAYAFTSGNYQLKLKSDTFYYEDESANRFSIICKTPTIEFSVK